MELIEVEETYHTKEPWNMKQGQARANDGDIWSSDSEEEVSCDDQAEMYEGLCVAAGSSFLPFKNPFKKKKKKCEDSNNNNDCMTQVEPCSFRIYGVKPNNHPTYGKSVCCIVANFTGDISGYWQDIRNITDFHRTDLPSDHLFEGDFNGLPMNNLTKNQFMQLLQAIQDFLNEAEDVDRFFMYILSHGDEHGIQMCQEGSDFIQEQDREQQPVRVQMMDVVNMFTHNKVPSLKSCPKVIINQSCKGGEILQAAGDPGSGPYTAPCTPPAKIAIGADVIVCDASSNNAKAWVSHSEGSVFISTLLRVMRDYITDDHFYDILVEVNNQVSQTRARGRREDNAIVEAFQMPCIHSQLTKKFYLAIPDRRK